MKLLATIKDQKEAEIVSTREIDIIDIKNPEEGSLGCQNTLEVENILKKIPEDMNVSIALGDMPNMPGTASMAVKGSISYNPNFIKIGLKDARNQSEIRKMLESCSNASESSENNSKLVAAIYADHYQEKDIELESFIQIASDTGFDGVMIDTLGKKEGNLLDFMTKKELKEFVELAKQKDLKTGLAGSLDKNSVLKLKEIQPDYVGIRGALCKENGRNEISSERLDKFIQAMDKIEAS